MNLAFHYSGVDKIKYQHWTYESFSTFKSWFEKKPTRLSIIFPNHLNIYLLYSQLSVTFFTNHGMDYLYQLLVIWTPHPSTTLCFLSDLMYPFIFKVLFLFPFISFYSCSLYYITVVMNKRDFLHCIQQTRCYNDKNEIPVQVL